MAVQNIPRPADEGASEPLLDAVAALLRGRWREMSPDFIAELYAHATADDLERYTPEEVAAIGEEAWSFLLERKPGDAEDRLYAGAADARRDRAQHPQ